MRIRKYEAPTMQEALDAVKEDLGSDAIILHTKTRRHGGLLGLWGKEMVEITASEDINVLEQPSAAMKPSGQLINSYKHGIPDQSAQVRIPAHREDTGLDVRLLQSDLTEIKSLVMNVLKRSKHADMSSVSDELLEAYLLLIEHEVSEELSKEIIQKVRAELTSEDVHSKTIVHNALVNTLVGMMSYVEPISCAQGSLRKIALVGPTGVGKTTTIAKLAAHFSLKEKKDVALITIDTYRIAAVEQLRTYAEIINVPLDVVLTPMDMKRAIEKHKHRDLVFIDTAGRSQKNAMQMYELKSFIDAVTPDEIHLVLSTTTSYKTIQDVIDHFSDLAIHKIIFTKLDEAVSFGLILNVMKKLNRSLSYVTTGQNVPDDILVGNPEELVKLIVE